MTKTTKRATRIEIIWDHDHGTDCEGWYVRRWYSDGHDEDENLGGECDLPIDASDEDLIEDILPLEEQGIPVEVKR